jgi:predicted nucleic acid-binding protein
VNVLVDTSVWSLALRRKRPNLTEPERLAVADLAELIREGRARIIGPIRQELLSGVKSLSQYEKLREALQPFPDEVIDTSDYEAAARTGNDCRAKGIAVTPIDILICAIALRRAWSVFTTDPDVTPYSKVLPLKLHIPRS